MEIIYWGTTTLYQIVQWIGGKIGMIFVGRWLKKMREHVANAITASDFKVTLVSGVDPLRLKFEFRLHNGSATVIQLDKVTLHLFCAGAHVGSVIGRVAKTPFIHTNDGLRISGGKGINISVSVIPDVYLWFWLLPSGGFNLESSSVEVSSIWGTIIVPLSGNISSDVREQKKNIDDFVDRVRRIMSITV